MKSNQELVQHLIKEGVLKSTNLISAFSSIDRQDFVPAELKPQAYLDVPLPIGFGQTISQPWTVAFMLELLSPQKGEKILDIGAGSGWTTALLGYCVGESGKVIGIELISELVEFAKKNIAKYNFIEKGIIEIYQGDGTKGFSSQAPYNKILVSASAQKIYSIWKEELKIGGVIVSSFKDKIVKIKKISDDKFQQESYYGFAFVPLIET